MCKCNTNAFIGQNNNENNKPKMILDNIDNTNVRTFIESLGWAFFGPCGCRNNMNKYANNKYPGYQIWIPAPVDSYQRNILQVRQTSDQFKGTYIIDNGGSENYMDIYIKNFK